MVQLLIGLVVSILMVATSTDALILSKSKRGGARYALYETLFSGGPDQVINSSWTPMFYAAAGINQCCGVTGSVGTITIRDSMWNRRGFYELANGGPGISLEVDNAYRQGGITPLFTVQSSVAILTERLASRTPITTRNRKRPMRGSAI